MKRRGALTVYELNERCKESVLAYTCSNCGTIFLNLTDKQLDLVKYIKKNKQLEIISTEKRYYPIEHKDWVRVKQRQYTECSKKFLKEIYFVNDDKYYDIDDTKLNNVFYVCNKDLVGDLGILSHETKGSDWKNINDKDINPENNEPSHSYDVDIKDIVTISDNFKDFENEFGNVYFTTYDEFRNLNKCPVCNAQNYKSNLIKTDENLRKTICSKNKKILYMRREAEKAGKKLSIKEVSSLKFDYGVVPILKNLVHQAYEEKLENNTNHLLEKYKKEIEGKSIITQECEKKPSFNLTAFLECLINCEKNKRILTEILKNQIKVYCKNQLALEKKKKMIKMQYINDIDNNLQIIYQNIDKLNKEVELTEEDLIRNNIKKPIEPIKPTNNNINKPEMPILKKPNFFNKTRIAIENQNLLKEYELSLKEYEDKEKKFKADIQEYNRVYSKYEDDYKIFKKKYDELKEKIKNDNENTIKKLNEEIEQLEDEKNNIEDNLDKQLKELPESTICDYLLKEIDEVKDEIIKINIAINQLNSLNIIYPKYNTFVALTTIYEYLITGRCDSLTGNTGAYNLYEQELRSNIIIDKLDTIIEKLDSIKNNQYQMYCILNDIKETQDEMCSLFDKAVDEITSINENTKNIEKLSSVVAYNTTKISLYSKINNRLLKGLGILVALK